jgi:hypothetical protein
MEIIQVVKNGITRADTDIVFYLNSLSTGIWQLLREPISVIDANNIVQQAFPDRFPKKIARDVSRLINDMSKRNLVLNIILLTELHASLFVTKPFWYMYCQSANPHQRAAKRA